MKAIFLIAAMLLAGCESQAVSGDTPNCNAQLGEGWSQGLGTAVESSSNLDTDRCAQIQNVWCCAL